MTGETSPPPPETARNEVLYALMLNGWANQSDGDPDCGTGHFAKISNDPQELQEVVEAFEDEVTRTGLSDVTQLVGHFLVIEDQEGLLSVIEYGERQQLDHDFRVLSEAYGALLREERS